MPSTRSSPSQLYAEIRTAGFDEDIGQNGWVTAREHDMFIKWLDLDPASHLLDVASGAGGTTLRIARLTGCLASERRLSRLAIRAVRTRLAT